VSDLQIHRAGVQQLAEPCRHPRLGPTRFAGQRDDASPAIRGERCEQRCSDRCGHDESAIAAKLSGTLTKKIQRHERLCVNLAVLSGARPATSRRLDVPGMVAFTVAAGGFTFAMIRASSRGWTSSSVLGLLLLGAAALAAFVAIQRFSDHALLDLALFRNRSFVGVIIAALLLNFAAFAY
jgi:hypothetical protein